MIGAAALCIVVGTTMHTLPAARFMLRWQHTVEKIVWEEDYTLVGPWLYLGAARVRGSGAGMEPPPDAVRVGDAWQYRPAERWHARIALARSQYGTDYELCIDGTCRPLSAWAPGPLETTVLAPCAALDGSTDGTR